MMLTLPQTVLLRQPPDEFAFRRALAIVFLLSLRQSPKDSDRNEPDSL
jgi:hypothetical protein